MLLVCGRKNGWPYSHSLFESSNFVASWFLRFLVSSGWCTLQLEGFFWTSMGPSLVKREKKCLEGCYVVDLMKGEK